MFGRGFRDSDRWDIPKVFLLSRKSAIIIFVVRFRMNQRGWLKVLILYENAHIDDKKQKEEK